MISEPPGTKLVTSPVSLVSERGLTKSSIVCVDYSQVASAMRASGLMLACVHATTIFGRKVLQVIILVSAVHVPTQYSPFSTVAVSVGCLDRTGNGNMSTISVAVHMIAFAAKH